MVDLDKERPPFAPWDRRELPGAFTVDETARRLGHYRWFEMRMFEVLGGWVASIPELDVKLRLGTHAHHHAWHAEQWEQRIPQLRETNLEALTVAPNDEAVAFVDTLSTAQDTVERLVGAYRVLIPHKVAAYRYHLANTSTITDGPTIRALRFILADEVEDWAEGEMMVQSLIGSADDVDRAAAFQARLEKLLAAGGIAGPGTLGG